jgi:MFS family permease
MTPPTTQRHRKLDPAVIRLGYVSLLTDVSSEMIFSVFAIVFTTVAGASTLVLGLVEGLADVSASLLTYMAGWLSDRSGRRKPLTLAGYALSTLGKGLLLVSSSVWLLACFRVLERLGKGLRGPPRDAWLADISTASNRGWSFGVHKAMDKAGAIVGPLLAYGWLSWHGESVQAYQALFMMALLPAVLSVWLLAGTPGMSSAPHPRERLSDSWMALSPAFKRFLWPAGVFALSYFSPGFFLLKAHSLGWTTPELVLLYALFNAICVISAPLAGWHGDRLSRRHVVMTGYAVYALLNGWMVMAQQTWEVVGVFVLYGVFYAVDESQTKAYMAELETHRYASAVGVYQLITGSMYLLASVLAGLLWLISPAWAFAAAAGLAILAMLVFRLSSWPESPESQQP